jgi:predicted HNH restriction endonuclease
MIEGDIVQLHHRDPLATAPAEGRQLTIDEAIWSLIPLCPNCHRIAHAKPDGGIFTLDELREIVQRTSASPAT